MEGKRFEDIVRLLIYIQLFLTSFGVGSSPCMPESDRAGRYTVRGGGGNFWSVGVSSGSRVQVSVRCDVGAIAQPSVTSQCSNGIWIPPWPRCVGSSQCMPKSDRFGPYKVRGGSGDFWSVGIPSGSMVQVSVRCDVDAIAQPSVTSQCSYGTWIPPWPRCEKPCSEPIRNRGQVLQFVNGDATRPITSYYTRPTLPDGTQLVARCRDPGKYRLIGDQRRTCQGGQWTGEEPACQPVETKVLFNGAWHEVATNGTVVVYVHRGNPLHLNVVCRVTGVWFRPPRLTTPLVNDGDLWHWHRLYTHGIRLDPISTDFSGMYTCNGSSSYHSVHVLFKAAECEVQAAPEHGRLLDGSREQPRDIFSAGTTVSFECEDDYSLVGSREVTCKKGQWSDDPPVCIVLPTPGAVMQGIFKTTENYTTSLEDPTSLAYKKFENKFITAVMNFYAQNHPEYIAYYEGTKVTDFEKSGKQAVVHFEVHFSQLDNDSSLPDAHTVLLDQVTVQHRLDPFFIITGALTATQT